MYPKADYSPRELILYNQDPMGFEHHGGVVARFDPGAIWAAFPVPPSRHHGVGLWPAELGHPVEDVYWSSEFLGLNSHLFNSQYID